MFISIELDTLPQAETTLFHRILMFNKLLILNQASVKKSDDTITNILLLYPPPLTDTDIDVIRFTCGIVFLNLLVHLFVKCSTHKKRDRNTKGTYLELNQSCVWSARGVNPFQRAEHADSE